MSVNVNVSLKQLQKLRTRFFGETGVATKSDCPITLNQDFLNWILAKVDTLEWNRSNGANSVSTEDIAFITGQQKIVKILAQELE